LTPISRSGVGRIIISRSGGPQNRAFMACARFEGPPFSATSPKIRIRGPTVLNFESETARFILRGVSSRSHTRAGSRPADTAWRATPRRAAFAIDPRLCCCPIAQRPIQPAVHGDPACAETATAPACVGLSAPFCTAYYSHVSPWVARSRLWLECHNPGARTGSACAGCSSLHV
jgi:hypothetical protein